MRKLTCNCHQTGMVDQEVLKEEDLIHGEVFHEDDKVGASPVQNKQLNVYDAQTYFNVITYYKGE